MTGLHLPDRNRLHPSPSQHLKIETRGDQLRVPPIAAIGPTVETRVYIVQQPFGVAVEISGYTQAEG